MGNEWISVDNKDILPPDELILVKDEFGNQAHANPTYYPFEVVKMPGDEKKAWGWRGTPVFFPNDEMRWDGGWMILGEPIDTKITGDITHWKADKQPIIPNNIHDIPK